MTTVWVFLIMINGHIQEVGSFKAEEECENVRKEIIIQRQQISISNTLGMDKEYTLNKFNETTKCFKVWK